MFRSLTNKGFSLIEVVMVLVIMASISVVVGVRFGSKGEQTIAVQADLMATQIRHMQGLAMSWDAPLHMNITVTGYNVQCVTATATAPCNTIPVRDPAANGALGTTLQDGVTLAGTNIEIDSLGRPRDPVTHAVMNTTQTLTLTSGTVKWNLAISPLTADITLTKI